jgi:hypothetical protein
MRTDRAGRVSFGATIRSGPCFGSGFPSAVSATMISGPKNRTRPTGVC